MPHVTHAQNRDAQETAATMSSRTNRGAALGIPLLTTLLCRISRKPTKAAR